jgi:signal transduction histidine kinase
VPTSSLPPTAGRGLPRLTAGAAPDPCDALAASLQRAREAEREALARELHDELGAILTAARLDVAWLAAQPEGRSPAIAQRLASLSDVLAAGIGLKRRIVEDLHPTVLSHLGLAAALEQLVAQHRARAPFELAARIDPRVDVAGEAGLALYRIAQEALTNVHKYAAARRVRVELVRERGRVRLTVDDDGCGFDPAAVGGGHHGLLGMRQRMRALAGSFEVGSRPGAGTTIRAAVAVARPAVDAATRRMPAAPARGRSRGRHADGPVRAVSASAPRPGAGTAPGGETVPSRPLPPRDAPALHA